MDAATRFRQLNSDPRPVFAAADDDALLRDALEFIGDLDFDLDSATPDEDHELSIDGLALPLAAVSVLPTSDASPQAPVSTGSWTSGEEAESDAPTTVPVRESEGIPPKPKSINRARTRRREEVAYLRELVGDLEEQLASLRSTQELTEADTNTEASAESTELVDAWAQIAARQSEQRQQSEQKNAELKRLLHEQIQVGKSLEHLLTKKRPKYPTFEGDVTTGKRPRHNSSRSWSWNNEMIFDELLADCAVLFSETASILTRFDDEPPARPRRQIQLVHDPDLGMVVQTIEHRILPFSYEDTTSVVWNTFLNPSTVHCTEYHDVASTENTMKLQFHMTSNIGRVRGDFAAKFATRLYVEAARTVIVVSAIFDPTEVSKTNMAGVRMRYTGWHVIEPMPSGATKMAVYYRAVPEVDDDLPDQTRKVGTLTNFVLSTFSVEMESRSQNVDNRLFELALRGGRTRSGT